MRRLFIALLFLASVCGLLRSASSADQATVNRLVHKLGSISPRDREDAERDLLKLGPSLLDQLPESTTSPQAAEAIERIRLTLEKAAAADAGRPSSITLHGTLPQQQIVREFERQTRQSIAFDANIAPADLKIDWNSATFWDAIAALENSSSSNAVGDSAKRAILFQPRPSNSVAPVSASSGPSRVEILSETLRPNLVDPTKAVLHIRWRLRMEPRLRPLYAIIADRDFAVTDGQTSFEQLSPDARRELPVDRWQGVEIDTSLQTPKSVDVTRLKANISGMVKVAALPLDLKFSDLDKPNPTTRRHGAATGVVCNVDFNSQLKALQFDLKLTYERGGPEFESHRMWIYQNAAWLVRKEDGARLPPAAVELKENAGAGATLAYLFENVNNPPGDFEFICEAPSLVIDVPFKVENLRLPTAGK